MECPVQDAEDRLSAAKLKTSKWDHYIGFVVVKATGFLAGAGAAVEFVAPTLLPIPEPTVCLAVSLALLSGKTVVGLVAKAADAFK